MPEKLTTESAHRDVTTTPMKRRGLLAAAWAAVAALVVKATSQPVAAAAGLMYQDVAGGAFVQNGGGGPTSIYSSASFAVVNPVFTGLAAGGTSRVGLAGGHSASHSTPSMDCGVWGYAVTNANPSAGVLGEHNSATGVGIWGRAGVGGVQTDGTGVLGESAGGQGVLGRIPATSNRNATAVYGLNYSSYAGPASGAGGFGVYGLSARGHGLVGATASAGGAAVVGATNGVAGAFAAAFYGPVIVGGDFTVVGGAKSAAVAHPDGTHRRLYCVESPESWFEDFGKGQLAGGSADVRINPDFAALVHTDDYHVFLTAHDDHDGLHVKNQRADGFTVRARGGSGCATFSWRVVAKRRDIEGPRLERVDIPKQPELPELPAIPSIVNASGESEPTTSGIAHPREGANTHA